jgi:hypothetical protein
MEDIKEIQIFLDLQGEPTHKGDICLSAGHGYCAYVSLKVESFICSLFKEMSLRNGPTDVYMTKDGRYFSLFELDCADKDFFKSRTFKKICNLHNVRFIILDNGSEYTQIMRDFRGQILIPSGYFNG